MHCFFKWRTSSERFSRFTCIRNCQHLLLVFIRLSRESLQRYNRFTCIRNCTDLLLVFISGEPLQSGSLGMSIPDSVCTKRALGVSQIPSYTEPQKLATVLSHMVGHNLGLKHDEDRK